MPKGTMKVSVLGAGSWGTTVASLVAGKNDATVWGRDEAQMAEIRDQHKNSKYLADYDLPENLHGTADLEEAVAGAHVLVVGVPSHAFRATLEAAKPFVHPWIPIISLTKGLEAESMLRMTEVIKNVLPGRPVAALSGPNLAKEIMAGQAAASVVATHDLEVAAALQAIFQSGLFRVYINHDVVGVEMGGEAATFSGLAGLGDLVATCVSKQSRNRYVGEQLGKGRPLQDILDEMNMVAEGVKTVSSVMQLGEQYGVDLPICGEVNKVVTGAVTGDHAYRGLFAMQPGHEAEPG